MKALCVFIVISSYFINVQAQDKPLKLFESPVTQILTDGVLDANEWLDAKELTIKGESEHTVTVLLKRDRDYLYVAFKNLTNSKGINHNAEVLIATNIEDTTWDENCYWFHSSYGNCSAIGQYYYWEDCTSEPIGWKANTFPFQEGNNNMEFKISFSRLNIKPEDGKYIRIAFKISNPLEQQDYWPESATISNPSSWGSIMF